MTLKKTTSGAPILMSAEYTYDVLNRLTNISFDNGSSVSYIYDKNGNVLSETVNGSVTEYQYNNAGLLTRQEGNGTTYEMAYRLDGNKISETVSGNIKEYWYNDIGQLLYETHWDNAKKEWATINYTYDSRGNRLTKDEDGSIDQYTYDRGNRLTNISEDDNSNWISYSYDNNGNMLTQNKGAYEDGVAVTNETSSYTYDAFNRHTGVTSGDMTASYVYNAEDRRISKTVNGVTTNHMWDRDNIIYESDASKNELAKYYYSRRLAESVEGSETKRYGYDPHGSVNSINGMCLYDYDSFGNLITNPQDISKHLYCGEYYDAETGFIYLRNRYYDPSIGRFITEDPIKDGINWYVYCGNNPVNFVDPLGWFDYDDRLGPSTEYNIDVEVLQNELAWLGYYSGDIDGYFGQKTLNAVNKYKNDRGLGNVGSDWGVVGKQTWESMGLICRTQDDINVGVEIANVGLKQYKDFSVPINNALGKVTTTAEILNVIYADVGQNYSGTLAKGVWFLTQVYHEQPWDIKYGPSWNKTIGANTFFGQEVEIIYNDNITTPHELGNYTYGYIGKALGFNLTELYGGSWVAAGLPVSGNELTNEFDDWPAIFNGYNNYKR